MRVPVEQLAIYRFCNECLTWLPIHKFIRGVRLLPRGRRRYVAHRCRACITRNTGGALIATRLRGLALTDKGRAAIAEVECEQ